ncbi:hypothetical protein BU24DRAFT_416220, partial [Aaosphaeria arxii CBS 175.79]
MGDKGQDTVVQLAEQLLEGFVSLSAEYQLLFDQQRQLENKLSWAKQQYLDSLKRHTPSTLSQDHLVFLQDLERAGAELPRSQVDWVEQLAQSDDIEGRGRASLIRQAENAAVKLRSTTANDGVKIWNGPSADGKQRPPLRIQSDISSLEKDFTTTGTPSKLGCPFAARSGRQSPLATPRSSTSRMSFSGRRSKRPSFTDPIRAEICGNDHQASPTASVDGSAAVCPIRFLDQHAPEEVAKYFENHKHEIPRSHEVCIKRFQSNTESIQQLDRKYGNMVSMIQGLGQKHQEYLPPEPEEDEEPETEAHTEHKVQKWAKAVSASLQNLTPEEAESKSPESAPGEARTAHFDRPMKEVRVGESPSRPWGISIPAKYTNAESSSSVGSAPTASPALPIDSIPPPSSMPAAVQTENPKPSKCPFDHRAMGMMSGMPHAVDANHTSTPMADATDPRVPPEPEPIDIPAHETTSSPPPERPPLNDQPKHESDSSPKMIPQLVFNGPVFLGYPPDQLMMILQNSNLGGTM